MTLIVLLHRVGLHASTIKRALESRSKQSRRQTRRGRKTLLSHDTMVHLCEVAALHDDQSEGLSRQMMVANVIKASGGKLSNEQATNLWQHTIHPLG